MANILVVDDSRDILEVLQEILEEDGHEVRVVLGKISMMKELLLNTPFVFHKLPTCLARDHLSFIGRHDIIIA